MLVKMVMKVLTLFLNKKDIFIVWDLRQVHDQILLIIPQKEFIKLNVKNVKIVNAFLNMKMLRII